VESQQSDEQEALGPRENWRRPGKRPSWTQKMDPVKENEEGKWPVEYPQGLGDPEADRQEEGPAIASKNNVHSCRPALGSFPF
jgi:hypothetical protein